MKKVLLITTMLFCCCVSLFSQQLYTTNTGVISFFSTTPVEDISASNKKVTSILNGKTNDIVFQMQIIQFKFPNSLMEEHFNENYMETSKYPKASFQGKINETIDFTKDGVYNVTATGNITIHGVTQHRTIAGKLTISEGKIKLDSVFEVALVDYKIEVPTVVFNKIAEKIKVTLAINYELKK
jgi:hypothetical protein